MKVSLLFSGQPRIQDPELFNKGLKKLTSGVEAQIIVCHWNKTGVSGNHNLSVLEQNGLIESERRAEEIGAYLDKCFAGFDVTREEYDWDKWLLNMDKSAKEVMNAARFSKISSNSVPQLYLIQKSYEAWERIGYASDVICRCRMDSLFVSKLKPEAHDVREGTIKTINFGIAYHPNRIYDIFFMCRPQDGMKVFNAYRNVESLVNDNYCNGLDKRDACRVLYLEATKNGLHVSSTTTRICDIYRGDLANYYRNLAVWGLTQKWSLGSDVKFLLEGTKNIERNSTIWLLGTIAQVVLAHSAHLRLRLLNGLKRKIRNGLNITARNFNPATKR